MRFDGAVSKRGGRAAVRNRDQNTMSIIALMLGMAYLGLAGSEYAARKAASVHCCLFQKVKELLLAAVGLLYVGYSGAVSLVVKLLTF